MTNKLTQLEKLIELNGDKEKYDKGLQVLNSGGVAATGNSKLIAAAVGILLIGTGLAMNPELAAKISIFVGTTIGNFVTDQQDPQPAATPLPVLPEQPSPDYRIQPPPIPNQVVAPVPPALVVPDARPYYQGQPYQPPVTTLNYRLNTSSPLPERQ